VSTDKLVHSDDIPNGPTQLQTSMYDTTHNNTYADSKVFIHWPSFPKCLAKFLKINFVDNWRFLKRQDASLAAKLTKCSQVIFFVKPSIHIQSVPKNPTNSEVLSLEIFAEGRKERRDDDDSTIKLH